MRLLAQMGENRSENAVLLLDIFRSFRSVSSHPAFKILTFSRFLPLSLGCEAALKNESFHFGFIFLEGKREFVFIEVCLPKMPLSRNMRFLV